MMRQHDFTASRKSLRFRVPIALGIAIGLAMVLAQIGGHAQGPSPDVLPYARSFLLTGNYVVGGVDVNSKSASNGFVNGSIAIAGVPDNADIVAATLYWETVWTTRAQLGGVMFRGETLTDIDAVSGVNKIVGVRETDILPLNPTTAACLGSGQKGQTIHVSEFSADVLRLLPERLDASDNWTGLRFANGSHSVRLPDRGTGDGAAISAGASLVIVYRSAAANEPLRKIVMYEGGYANAQGATATQTVRGILQSTGTSARVTAIGGSNQGNTTDRFRFFNERGSTVTLATDPFKSASSSDRGWSNPTFDINPATVGGAANAMPGGQNATFGEEVQLTFDHTKATPYECQTLSTIVFSADVKDDDKDGLPDKLEDSTSELRTPPAPGKPNGDAYPRLNLMGASSSHKDLLLEINATRTNESKTYGSATAPYNSFAKPDGNPIPPNETWCTPQGLSQDVLCSVSVPQHTHMPDPGGLYRMGAVYAAHGITPHFDVGNTTDYLGAANDCGTANEHNVCQYLVRNSVNGVSLPRGGETFLEDKCNAADPTCQFPDYPGSIGWPFGFELFRDAPVSDSGQELTTPAELQDWANGTGNTTYRRRFDVVRRDLFHYILYGHARGNPKSLPCIEDGFPAPYDAAASTCSRPGVTTNPSFRPFDYKVLTSSSGVADQPGGNVLITLGLWDKLFGTADPFLQSSTTFHEVGHNLGLGHGGALPIPGNKVGNTSTPTIYEPNCKPNYQSSMSYLFQAHGLIDKNFEQQINYSEFALNAINENGPIDGTLWAPNTPPATLARLYRPTWFAPAASQLALDLGVTHFEDGALVGAATRLCNGFRIGAPPTGELTQQPPDTVRVWANSLSNGTWDVPFDWMGDGVLGSNGPANVNFDGSFQGGPTFSGPPGLTGFDDWSAIRLNQITAGKNLVLNEVGKVWEGSGALWQGGGSLWQGGGAIWQGGGALWQGGGAIWQGGGSLWQGGGALWQGGGSLWQGGGALWQGGGAIWEGGGALWQGGGQGGELDFESAKALGRTPPTAFNACVLGATAPNGCVGPWRDNNGTVTNSQPGPFGNKYHRVYTSWTKPSVGTVAGYLVFRSQGTNNAFAQICGTTGRPACPGADDTNFVDEEELPNGVSFTYHAKATFNDDSQNQISPTSNDDTITGVNDPAAAAADPPIALPASYTINEDTTLTVAVPGLFSNDSDPDSPALGSTVTVVPPPGAATQSFALNGNGSFTFTPVANFYGTITFQYKIVPATFVGPPAVPYSAESNVAVVTIVVNPVNDPPSFNNAGNQTSLEDAGPQSAIWATGISAGPLNETDDSCTPLNAAVCQQTVSFVVTGNDNASLFTASGAPAVAPNGTLSYTAAPNANGVAHVTLHALDTGGTANAGINTSGDVTFTITVTEVNDAPVPSADVKQVDEDCSPTAASSCATPLTFPSSDLSANDGKGGGADENGQVLTVTAVTGGASTHGVVALLGDGTVTYAPESNYNGPASFGYTVCDNGTTAGVADPTCADGTVNVTVTPVNDNPVAQDDSANIRLNNALVIPVLTNDSDVDLDTLTVSDFTSPAHGSLAFQPNHTAVKYTPAVDYVGEDSFDYTIDDGHLGTATAHVTLTVKRDGAGPDMVIARRAHTSTPVVIGGIAKILIAGGRGPCVLPLTCETTQGTAELYDPSPNANTFGAPISLVQARENHVAIALNDGRVLLAGGANDAVGPLNSAELFNPANGTFTATPTMPHAHAAGAGVLLANGKVLVTGGATVNGDSADLYDPVANTWTPTSGAMNVSRFGHTATLLPDGKVLIVGGSNGTNAVASAEIFDPATGLFALADSLSAARFQHTATLLPNGKVMVAGGFGSAALASVEIYDPGVTSGSHFLSGGSLVTARYQHTATLLTNGLVLLAGGGTSGAVTGTLEAYDPIAGSSTFVDATMINPRSAHAASILPDGKVFISGGSSNTVQFLNTTDVFKP